jgi:hypothetical protein
LKDRGYGNMLQVNHTGTVKHTHLDINKLLDNVSPAAQREFVQAIDKLAVKALPAHDDAEDAEFEVVKPKKKVKK